MPSTHPVPHGPATLSGQFSRSRAVARPPRAVIISASIGAGHDGAAREIAARLRAGGFEVTGHDFVDLLPAGLGPVARAGYARQLRTAPDSWGWLLGALHRHGALADLATGLTRRAAGRRVNAAVGPATDVVVSTYPLASQALGWLRQTGLLAAPVVTFLTDMSVHPLWVAPGVDAHLAVHEVPAREAAGLGARDVRVSGPAVPEAFGPALSLADRRSARTRFGLPHRAPLALVVAGSWGVGDIVTTVDDIARSGVATPVVACGRNETLRRRLTGRGAGIALGWTDDMPSLLRSCDVVVQNAGGLSSLEALASGVPVVTYRCLSGHGLTNARALEEAGWAVWIRTPAELPTVLTAALAGEIPTPTGWGDADPATAIASIAGIAAVPAGVA